MGNILADVVKALVTGLLLLLKFLAILLLGLLVAIIFIIPWLIRLGALLVFAYGLFEITLAVDAIYAPFSDTIPLLALYAFVGIVQLALFFVVSALDLRLIWGATYLSGVLSHWAAKHGIVYILENWQYADLFFRAVPPLLFIALIATETLKAARRRDGYQEVRFTDSFSAVVHATLDRIESIGLPTDSDAALEAAVMEAEGGDAV